MYDVITIGGASQDMYLKNEVFKKIKSREFPAGFGQCLSAGTKIELENVIFETGGGGTNSAVALSRLGLNCAFLGKIGEDTAGQEIINVLKKENVATHLIVKDEKRKTAFAIIVLDHAEEKTILVFRGAEETLNTSEIDFEKLETKWFYITSLAGNLELLEKLISYANTHNIKIALNPGVKELAEKETLKSILKRIDILLLNFEEAEEFTGKNKIEEIMPGLIKFSNMAVITMAAQGAIASDGKNIYEIPTTTAKDIQDTTGAGDAFGSAFLAGMILKDDIRAALQLGIANSRAVLMETGAKNGLLKAIPQQFEHEVKIKEIFKL